MAITYVDQMMAYLAVPANVPSFAAAVGLAAYAETSFTRRYAKDGFQVDGVVLGDAQDLQLQSAIDEDVRITGTCESRVSAHERVRIDYRVNRWRQLGWIDVLYTTPVSFALHAVPGSISLGPGGDVQQAGLAPATPPMTQTIKFSLPTTTDPFTFACTLQVLLFIAADPAPTDDLRRIQAIRRHMEADPRFLATLDGSPDQRPLLFAQVYPAAAADGGLLNQAATAQLFNAADVLAAFFTPPA